MKQYQILADEGWTHSEIPPNRYHHFFVSVSAPSDTISLLEQKLKECNKNFKYPHRDEIKWSKLNGRFFEDYKILIDTFFDFWETHHELKYRQLFMDKKYAYSGEINPKDRLFRIYYQFIKHSFGFDSDYFKSLDIDNLLFKLDDYPDRDRKEALREYVENHHKTFDVKVDFINSKSSYIHQIIDIIMGAAGYYGNFKCCKVKGEKLKIQHICKIKLAKYIQKRLEFIEATDRGTKVFNWYSNTGAVKGQNYNNRYKFKIMIWKFKPKEYRKDESFDNDKELSNLKGKRKYYIKKSVEECSMFDGHL